MLLSFFFVAANVSYVKGETQIYSAAEGSHNHWLIGVTINYAQLLLNTAIFKG